MADPKKCPECGQTNLLEYRKCDCGYDFGPGEERNTTPTLGFATARFFVVIWTAVCAILLIYRLVQANKAGDLVLSLDEPLPPIFGELISYLTFEAVFHIVAVWALGLVGVAAAIHLCKPKSPV